MASSKPVIHGPDHLPGGADPIPTFGLGDFIHWEGQGAYNNGPEDDNVGNYIVINADGTFSGDLWGAAIEIAATNTAHGGIYLADGGIGGLTLREYGTGELFLTSEDDSAGTRILDTSSQNVGLSLLTNTSGIQVVSGGGTSFVFTPTTNSVLIRVGDGATPTAGIIALDAFCTAGDADSLASFYVGNLTLGSPAVSHHGITAVLVENNATCSFWVARGTGINLFQVDWGGQVWMPNLPTSNPGGSGKLWKNGNVVNIT